MDLSRLPWGYVLIESEIQSDLKRPPLIIILDVRAAQIWSVRCICASVCRGCRGRLHVKCDSSRLSTKKIFVPSCHTLWPLHSPLTTYFSSSQAGRWVTSRCLRNPTRFPCFCCPDNTSTKKIRIAKVRPKDRPTYAGIILGFMIGVHFLIADF